ncbi:hypothetical protein NL532_18620 [Mesorhizobium sp. C120A]|uniref:hypothetical protein n=1 Tax=unclassified Mesorhizobium TaxID=325217 RepID=UPI0003CFE22B|nr:MULTISPECIES: hypothetical protein [unclassified Mesorhizobium]ESZ54638.1 hypothetical protein X728_31005 [Mesorhizobium sp. L103C120A0]WJI42690.1 hypothetical protein NL532_18620 [Mesorhizobium sp. C120A]
MGKKPKQHAKSTADREKAIEALYFARKCGLTKEEALKMLKEAPIGIDDEAESAPAVRGDRQSRIAAGRGA